jgi:hypothetical protein
LKRSKSKKIALIVSGTIGLLAFTFLLIKELKIAGFKRALVELVDSKTNGQYKLIINEADFDLQKLSFLFQDVAIVKTDTADHTGRIQSVRIPSFEACLGSFLSFMSSQQITIVQLDIEEPIVKVDASAREQSNKLNLGQTLVKIFPPVESVLERFNIKLLQVKQGNLKVDKKDDELINLRFIDLLVKDWNARQLTEDSKVQLNIRGQKLNVSQSSFSFSELEYRYPEHYLIFKDFTFHSMDTSTTSEIDVKGKSVLIKNLDYNELYTNQRYKLDKIEIIEPKFSGTLQVNRKAIRDRKYRLPVSDMLKRAFGEIRLDSAIIKDAAFQMTLTVNEDSIRANIPLVNINLHTLEVIEDSTDIQFGELQMDLSETELSLNDNVRLTCNEMFFEKNEDFTISNLKLTETATGKSFVACDRIGFKFFRFFEFLISHQLRAEEINIEDADVNLSPQYLNLLPNLSGNKTSDKASIVNIGNIWLKNVNLSYTDNSRRLRAMSLYTRATGIRELSGLSLLKKLTELKLRALSFSDENLKLETNLESVNLTQSSATMQSFNLAYGSLNINAEGVTAIHVASYPASIDYTSWKKVEFGKLVIRGRPPQNAKLFSIGDLSIRDLVVEIKLRSGEVSLKGKNLHTNEFRSGEAMSFSAFTGKLYQVGIKDSVLYTSLDSVNLDTGRGSKLYNIHLSNPDMVATIPYAEADSLVWSEGGRKLSRFFAVNPEVRKRGIPVVTMDSLSLHNIVIADIKRTSIQEAVFHEPFLNISAADSVSGTAEKGPFKKDFINMVSTFTIHGGKIKSGKDQVTFSGVTTGQLHNGITQLACAQAELETSQNKITAKNIIMAENEMQVTSVSMEPKPQFFENAVAETDAIEGEWRDISISGLVTDSLIHDKKVIADKLTVNSFTVNVTRDRRLPDTKNPNEKPFTIDELLGQGGLHAKEIDVRDGSVRYTEISEKTGQEGTFSLQNVSAIIKANSVKSGLSLAASASLYDQATVNVDYQTLSPDEFELGVQVSPLDLPTLNQIILPLQAMEIKSGKLNEFNFQVIANRDSAKGEAVMSYEDLHVDIFKPSNPDKKNLGNEVLTFLTDGIGLKHKKEEARAPILQARIHEKSVFNYWVKIASNGALNVVRRGKRDKKRKRK